MSRKSVNSQSVIWFRTAKNVLVAVLWTVFDSEWLLLVICLMRTVCGLVVGLYAWVFLLVGGVDSVVFGSIQWCVWSFRPSSPVAAAAP